MSLKSPVSDFFQSELFVVSQAPSLRRLVSGRLLTTHVDQVATQRDSFWQDGRVSGTELAALIIQALFAWPLVVIIFLLSQRAAISRYIDRIRKASGPGGVDIESAPVEDALKNAEDALDERRAAELNEQHQGAGAMAGGGSSAESPPDDLAGGSDAGAVSPPTPTPAAPQRKTQRQWIDEYRTWDFAGGTSISSRGLVMSAWDRVIGALAELLDCPPHEEYVFNLVARLQGTKLIPRTWSDAWTELVQVQQDIRLNKRGVDRRTAATFSRAASVLLEATPYDDIRDWRKRGEETGKLGRVMEKLREEEIRKAFSAKSEDH